LRSDSSTRPLAEAVLRVSYFGTWERGYPRNEQVISSLRSAGVEVDLVQVNVWASEHKFAPKLSALPRLGMAELKLALNRIPAEVDALVVGYPGQVDIWAAKRHGKPVVFNAMVSLYDTFVEDRQRFRAESIAGRALREIDRRAFAGADLLVSDTRANAKYMAEIGGIEEPPVCYVGAEERLFKHTWQRPERFCALFVGKLIPLHGLDVILEAARLIPDVDFRIIGSGQLGHVLADRPANVDHVPWIDYEDLPREYAAAGCALGIFGSSPKAQRVIPNKAFQALAVGAPLVTANAEGARELLTNGRDALLTDSTPASLAETIVALRDDHVLAERIGGAGRETFEREASEQVLGRRWRGLIEGQLRGRT
jgi:glycosyltransferase involved in cell wall biosynthesis